MNRGPDFSRFADGPLTVELPRQDRRGLGRRAVLAVATLATAAAMLPAAFGPADPIQGAYDGAAGLGKGALGKSEYGAVVDAVQAQADAELGKGKVVIFRRDLPMGQAVELASKGTGYSARSISDAVENTRGAFAVPDDEHACLVVGDTLDDTVSRQFVMVGGGLKADTGDVTTADSLLWSLHHEIAHCLGADEPTADAFAAMKAIKFGKSRDIVPLTATYRELDEWTTIPEDDHNISPVLSEVARRAASLRADRAFMAGDWQATYKLAAGMGERHAPTAGWLAATGTIRAALWKTNAQGAHYAVVRDGMVLTDLDGWFAANRSIPEIDRIAELRSRLVAPPAAEPLPVFVPDHAASAAAALAAASYGDPTAKLVAKALGQLAPGQAPGPAPELVAKSAVHGVHVAFDPAATTLVTGLSGFCLKQDGATVAAGTHDQGVTKTFQAEPGPECGPRHFAGLAQR